MKLKTPPPPAILAALKQAGSLDGQPDPFRISIATDINLLGQYTPQWVMASDSTIWVFDEVNAQKPALTLSVAEVEEFRTFAVVGSGLLQAKVNGIWLDVVRDSNQLKYHFGRAARRLDQLRKNEPFTLNEEDDVDPRRCAVSGILLEYPGQTSPFAVKRGRVIQRVMLLMRPYMGAAVVMMALMILGISIDLIMPRLTGTLVDGILTAGKRAEYQWPTAALRAYRDQGRFTMLLLLVVFVYALAQIARAIVNVINGRIGSRVATSITFDMRGRLVEHLEKLSLAYYDKQSTGSLVGRVAYDTEAVQGFVGQLTGGFLMQILLVLASGFFMYSASPSLTFYALLPAPFVMAMAVAYYRWVYPNYERFWERSSKQAGMVNGILSGIRVVKSFAQEDREFQRFQRSSGILRDARRSVDTSAATYYPIFSLVFQVGGWIVWYVGGTQVLMGLDHPSALAVPVGAGVDQAMSLGRLMTFFGLLGLFYAPLTNLTNLSSWLTQFSTQMHRIFEVLDTPISIPESGKPVPIPTMKGEIEFKNVIFGYSRTTPILKSVSFHIKPGQMIGVVGRSGSGKTTIINLISRFYDIDEGQILIDGVEIRQISTDDLRRQIGVVLQEPFLFRGTLWENMVYGRTDATIDEVIAASRAGNSHDFIMRQLQAYDTWVGERGAGLSGGERQRLSIARALLCEPRILILDEATSSVDSESELAIQKALAELVKGRTAIIIAHRFSTLRNCDTIMVIDEGKLIENGTHEELMKLDKKYAKLVKIQGATQSSDSIDKLEAEERDKKAEAETPPDLQPDKDTGLTPITSHRPRWLEPRFTRIHLGNHNALHVTLLNERIYNGVFALRCMPVRHPDKYISLRWFNADNREQEIGLIRDMSQWPPDAQKLIQESLVRRYLIHNVQTIESIRMEHNYLMFAVQTDLGPRQFVMRWSHDTAVDYGPKGKVLVDVEENRYVVPDVSALPEPGRARFERYIYW